MPDRNQEFLQPGDVVDNYRVKRLLGSGGFGATYLAEEQPLGRAVVIKEFLPRQFAARGHDGVIRPYTSEGCSDSFSFGLQSFLEEARTLLTFDDPNIVPILRFFEANGTGYFAMPYFAGATLSAMLGPKGTLSEAEIRPFLAPLLDGLETVHRARYLHRDIKPANIFIRERNRPLLIDFGAARLALGEHTRDFTGILTPGFAPLEQYDRQGNQGPWTDLYALGATLYRCVTGETPPESTMRARAILMPNARDPMPTARIAGRARASEAFLAAIDRSLAVMEADRPQSVAEFRALLDGKHRAAAPEPRPRPTPEPPPVPRPRPEPTPPRPVVPRPRASRPWARIASALTITAIVVGGIAPAETAALEWAGIMVAALSSGALIFLTAAGLAYTFRLSGVPNLAQGAFVMLGGYAGAALFKAGGGFWLALALVPIGIGILGFGLERALLRPLRSRGALIQTLMTFAAAYALSEAARRIWPDIQTIGVPEALAGVVEVGGVPIARYQIFLGALALAAGLVLWALLARARGSGTAAVAAFPIAAALGGLAGVAAAPLLTVSDALDALPLAIMALMIGGTSLGGALVGSLAVAVVEAAGRFYLPDASHYLIYLVLVPQLLLLADPFGKPSGEALPAMAPADRFGAARLEPVATLGALALFGLVPVLFAIPSPVASSAMIAVLFAGLAHAVNLLVVRCGLVSLGHAALFGIGGYAVAILLVRANYPIWEALPAAVAIAALVAAALAVICVRLNELAFLLVSYVLAVPAFAVAVNWKSVTAGVDGIPLQEFGIDKSLADYGAYYAALVLLALLMLLLAAARRSSPGRGPAQFLDRVWVLAVSGAAAGFFGAGYAILIRFISPELLAPSAGAGVIAILFAGGVGTLFGPLLASTLISAASYFAGSWWNLVLAVALVLSLLALPRGLWGVAVRSSRRSSA